jgi:hypothetical protein
MKFNYDGKSYVIEFERQRRKALLNGAAPSRLTTARVVDITAGTLPGKVYREVSSACAVVDQFNYEKGRIAALRLLSLTLDKGFKKAMWTAYINRKKG